MLKFTYLLLPFALMPGVSAEAQLFGSRSIGQPLQRRVGPSRFSRAGDLQGNERFLRGNRAAADFVGSDQREQQGFVGSEQARGAGAVTSSVAGLRERTDRSSQMNRPLTLPGVDEMYHPRLRLGFALPGPSVTVADLGRRVTEELAAPNRFSERSQIVVSVEGRMATLRGEVASARERDLAELVVLVEPGISQAKNELNVVDPLVPPQPAASPQNSSSEALMPAVAPAPGD